MSLLQCVANAERLFPHECHILIGLSIFSSFVLEPLGFANNRIVHDQCVLLLPAAWVINTGCLRTLLESNMGSTCIRTILQSCINGIMLIFTLHIEEYCVIHITSLTIYLKPYYGSIEWIRGTWIYYYNRSEMPKGSNPINSLAMSRVEVIRWGHKVEVSWSLYKVLTYFCIRQMRQQDLPHPTLEEVTKKPLKNSKGQRRTRVKWPKGQNVLIRQPLYI